MNMQLLLRNNFKYDSCIIVVISQSWINMKQSSRSSKYYIYLYNQMNPNLNACECSSCVFVIRRGLRPALHVECQEMTFILKSAVTRLLNVTSQWWRSTSSCVC